MRWCSSNLTQPDLKLIRVSINNRLSSGRARHRAEFHTLLRPRQNGRHFPDTIFKYILENSIILVASSLKFVPWGPIPNNSSLVRIMGRCQTGAKPLHKSVMTNVSNASHAALASPGHYEIKEDITWYWYTYIKKTVRNVPLDQAKYRKSCYLSTSQRKYGCIGVEYTCKRCLVLAARQAICGHNVYNGNHTIHAIPVIQGSRNKRSSTCPFFYW